MVPDMKGTGRQIYSMGLEKRYGPMVVNIKEIMFQVKNMGKERTPGLMDLYMMETGMRIELKAMETILGQMEDATQANG